jgi:hypothetical protein
MNVKILVKNITKIKMERGFNYKKSVQALIYEEMKEDISRPEDI